MPVDVTAVRISAFSNTRRGWSFFSRSDRVVYVAACQRDRRSRGHRRRRRDPTSHTGRVFRREQHEALPHAL